MGFTFAWLSNTADWLRAWSGLGTAQWHFQIYGDRNPLGPPSSTSPLLAGLFLMPTQASLGKGSRPGLSLVLPPALSGGGSLEVSNACDAVTPQTPSSPIPSSS